jgi:hypothetical protein
MMRILYLGALAMVAAAPASAADFTFDVPVRVENLPSLTTIRVRCSVQTAEPDRHILGNGYSAYVSVTGGRFEGTIMVEVNNDDAFIPSSDARIFDCALIGEGTSRTGRVYALSPSYFVETYERATGHTIVTANNQVRGTIP